MARHIIHCCWISAHAQFYALQAMQEHAGHHGTVGEPHGQVEQHGIHPLAQAAGETLGSKQQQGLQKPMMMLQSIYQLVLMGVELDPQEPAGHHHHVC